MLLSNSSYLHEFFKIQKHIKWKTKNVPVVPTPNRNTVEKET